MIGSRCDRGRALFCGFKTVLDRPAMAFDRDQRFNGCSCRAPGGGEGEVIIGDAPTDQQAACPQAVICAVELPGIEICQFEMTPIVQPRAFGPVTRRQAFPVGRAPRRRDVRGGARDGSPLAPGSEYVSAADPKHMAFACPTQLLLDVANTVDCIAGNPPEWYRCGYRARDHSCRKLWFGREACVGRHVCRYQTIRIVGPFFRKIQRAIDERMAMTYPARHRHPNPCDRGSPAAAMGQDRQLLPRASSPSCVAHRRADLPDTGLHSSQPDPARTTDVSAS